MFAMIWMACAWSAIYAPCDVADDCPTHQGVVTQCLDGDGEDGFCTWSCTVDADCAFDEVDDWPRVCAPLESEEGQHWFPSCEGAGDDEPDACPRGFGCRSTGGGSDKRKICFPSGE